METHGDGPSVFTAMKRGALKVAIIGAGNFGSAIAKIAAQNAAQSHIFDDEIRWWCLEEFVDGKKLTQIINETHVNVKYLPDITLPSNAVAFSDLVETCKDANLLVFVLPHQFLKTTLTTLKGLVSPNAKAISLIKGCLFQDGKPLLCSSLIESMLGIDCSVLSGANVAGDVAKEYFSETTIGYNDRVNAAVWQQLFDTTYFRVQCIPDVHGVELCGCIKNVIALSAGFCDGLGFGTNTKAAVMRLGVEELRTFACMFFDGIIEETFLDSAGYADVITTCLGGRNVRCAKEFVLRGPGASWEDIERDLLKGQKLQGHLSCKEIYEVISMNRLEDFFPLFVATYQIAFENAKPDSLLKPFQKDEPRRIRLPPECNDCVVPPALAQIHDRLAALQRRRHARR